MPRRGTGRGIFNYGTGGGDGTRLFELRFVTCSIDTGNFAISSVAYPPLVASSKKREGVILMMEAV